LLLSELSTKQTEKSRSYNVLLFSPLKVPYVRSGETWDKGPKGVHLACRRAVAGHLVIGAGQELTGKRVNDRSELTQDRSFIDLNLENATWRTAFGRFQSRIFRDHVAFAMYVSINCPGRLGSVVRGCVGLGLQAQQAGSAFPAQAVTVTCTFTPACSRAANGFFAKTWRIGGRAIASLDV
jgi:hypothetical protein